MFFRTKHCSYSKKTSHRLDLVHGKKIVSKRITYNITLESQVSEAVDCWWWMRRPPGLNEPMNDNRSHPRVSPSNRMDLVAEKNYNDVIHLQRSHSVSTDDAPSRAAQCRKTDGAVLGAVRVSGSQRKRECHEHERLLTTEYTI
jgi:hypothetical protein